MLSPVLLYCLVSFWLSLYRDRKAQEYLKSLAQFKIREAAARDYVVSERRRKRQLAIIERFQGATTKHSEESVEIQRKIEALAEKQDEDTKPLAEGFDTLMKDPDIRKLDLKLDAIIDESPREWRKYLERTSMLTDIGKSARVWSRFWYALEVAFPSGLGLIAFLIPLPLIW